MKLLPKLVCAIGFLALMAGCAPAPTSAPVTLAPGLPATEADVPRVSAADAKAALDSGEAVMVDVRSAESYAAEHAAGAVSVPLDEVEQNPGSLPLTKTDWIITYCT